jgi:hypothetical protein
MSLRTETFATCIAAVFTEVLEQAEFGHEDKDKAAPVKRVGLPRGRPH